MVNLNLVDGLVLAAYFFAVFFLAWKVTHRSKDAQSTDYFLGGRDLSWFLVGASLFASNIGSEHLIGLAGSGAASGLPVAQFEILAGFILLILGWVFVPFYLRSGVVTMPEFLEKRYGSGARIYLSIVSVLAYVMTKISVTIYAGAVVFEAIGVPFWIGAVLIVLATGAYTVFGGLKAVVYTDALQMIVMVGGSLLLTAIGLNKLGGWEAMTTTVPGEFMSLWRSHDNADYPWTGILFGAPILGVWYWCTDQFIVQRVLSAKNIEHARRGTILGGFLKMLPLFIFVIPGVIAYALQQKGLLTLPKNDAALPSLVGALLPSGLRGLVVAGLFAALMSSLSSVFNSCSTLITYDFYKKMRPEADEKSLIRFGQMATLVLVVMGLAWIPLMKTISGELFKYLQSVQAYISPPIASVFLLGLFSKKLNYVGAMSSLWTGFVLGIGRLVCEIFKTSLSGFWLSFASINFLHFALFLFVICSVVLITVSLFTEQKEAKDLSKLTFDYSKKEPMSEAKKLDLIWTILLVLTIFVIWWIFS